MRKNNRVARGLFLAAPNAAVHHFFFLGLVRKEENL